MRRSTQLVSTSIMVLIVAVAAACGGTAAKPTAEPPTPTPVPTVVPGQANTDSGARVPDGAGRQGVFTNPEVQACLASELGDDIDPTTLGRALFSGGLSEDLALAFDACGVDTTTALGDLRGFGGGGLAGAVGRFDEEAQACLANELGEDFAAGPGGLFSGENDELTAVLERCGVEPGDGVQRGGAFGGAGRFGGAGGFVAPVFQECLATILGGQLAGGGRGFQIDPETQEALTRCREGVAIPVEPDGGIGDGVGPVPAEPTTTPIPVSDLTIEQLTCLSSELKPADLASAVIATSSGDLSGITDAVLAALQTCGVGA